MKRILFDILVIAVAATTIWYVYTNYGERILFSLFGEQADTIYIENLAIKVMVADEPDERKQGLSGVESLRELQGMLFVFDDSDTHGIWMKDMLIPLDIIWINDQFEIVYIERNATPESYPKVFSPREPARFVLEVNAFFSESFGVAVGDKVTIPASILPADLKERVVEDAFLQ